MTAVDDSVLRFRTLFESAPIGMAVIPADSDRLLLVNKAFADMLGYSIEECRGLTIDSITYEDDKAPTRRTRADVVEGRADNATLEKRYVRKDGGLIWVSIGISLARDGSGAPEYVISQIQDISERKRVEAELAESRERFRSLVENASDWVWEVDAQGRYTYSSPVVRELLGYEPEEVMGKTPFDLMPPEEAGRVSGVFLSAVADRAPLDGLENVNRHKDGHLVVLETSGVPILSESGELLGYRGMDRDITARKAVEKQLAESEARYRSLVEHSPDAIFVADIETGKIVSANSRAAELIKRPLSEIVGMDQWELHPLEEREAYRRLFREQAAQGVAVSPEIVVVTSEGQKVPVEVSSSSFELGGRTLVQGVFRDISRRLRNKQLSDALNDANQDINSTLDIDEIMERVVVRAAQAIGCDSASINMREDDRWVIRYHFGMEEAQLGARFTDSEAKTGMKALETGDIIVVNHPERDDRVDERTLQRFNIKSLMTVPLKVHGESLGVLYFQHQTDGREFDEADVDFARKLAANISFAVQNSGLFAEQSHIAETLQGSLLSVPKAIDGLRFGHLYRAAGSESKVGGDFYDLFELPGGRCGVIVGDVSGKGLQAATLTMLIKNSLKAYIFQGDAPNVATAKTGLLLEKSTGASMFVTTFVAVIDPQSCVVTYCSAGHPPALLKCAGGLDDPHCELAGVRRLSGGGPLLGAFRDAKYESFEANMCARDIMLMYTDGVTEARVGGDLYGEERLEAFVGALEVEGPESLPGAILDEVTAFTGGQLKDDCAIVAVQLV